METDTGIKDVDCFFVYPTVTLEPENGSQNISLSNQVHKEKAKFCINPINWKRDETVATARENMGSVFFDENTYKRIEVDNYANASVDNENGVVICSTITDNNKYAIVAPKFPDDVYHMTEYGFYYNNLRQNVANRIEHYLHP